VHLKKHKRNPVDETSAQAMTTLAMYNLRWVLAWCVLLCTTGCHSEFFLDTGHVDNVQGVAFVIKAPHLFIKKAFQLRGELLSAEQLSQIAVAMPAIAEFTEALLRQPLTGANKLASLNQARALRPLMNLPPQTTLFVKTIHNWKVYPSTIEFSTDYFYANAQGEFVNFRDSYAFELTAAGWQFSNHPRQQAEGLLRCIQSAKGWRVCGTLKLTQ
jgi:hypothetical protein